MMSKPPLEFMEKYGVDSDEIWEVRRGGAWAIKHSALERIAAEQGIHFGRPSVIEANTEKKIAVVCVFATLNEREEWSFGEAAPNNNRNEYPWAMAEKRAKDRCCLKLLNAHGAIYSEDEADDFKKADKPQPDTIEPKRLAKKDAKEVYAKLQREYQECMTREQLAAWREGNLERINTLPEDWQQTLTTQMREHYLDLKNREAA